METILDEIGKALAAHLYYLAVSSALTLPDICAALESPDGNTSGARYQAWYNKWLAPKYTTITSRDMYSLRCGVLHQGRFGHEKMQYSRVLFTMPGSVRAHNNIFDDALNLDAVIFCEDVLDSVARWYAAKKDDQSVQANLPRLLKLRPDGLAPYVVGMPIIA